MFRIFSKRGLCDLDCCGGRGLWCPRAWLRVWLEDEEDTIRAPAPDLLGEMEEAAWPALTNLQRLLRDESACLRRQAREAMAKRRGQHNEEQTMNVDVTCVCGRVHEVTPLIPKADDGVYVPFDPSHTVEQFKDGEVDSIWRGAFRSSYNSVTCECGKAINVVVELEVVEKQDPLIDLAIQRFFIEFPGGKQVHATQHGNDEWKQDTYLYEEGELFYFESYASNGQHEMFLIRRSELKEHVAKLVPLLFTPEELKQLLAPT